MKKLIFALFISIISINFVYADTNIYFNSERFYSSYSVYEEMPSSVPTTLISYYNINWSSTYDYYVIAYFTTQSNNCIYIKPLHDNNKITAYITANVNIPTFIISANDTNNYTNSYRYCYTDDISSGSYSLSASAGQLDMPYLPYSSNSDLIFNKNSFYGQTVSATIGSWSNIDYDVSYSQLDISDGDTIPTYQSLTTGSTPTGFTSVNLSSYDYIVLSLKDYTQEPFNTTIYTQGSLCLTPVYNYGMQQKQELYSGYQVQGCTEVYSSDTPVNVYVIQADLTNHAVYYIKQQQNTPTTIKVPTSIFDITYINSNNTDPQVVIGGRSYPVIPYSDLTDTANKSTNEGYISGRVCSLGDVNCQAENMGMDISDLFTSPLTLLQTLWTSITSIFTIIATFIAILPPTLQVFLYTSFMLGIILGIIKIIL